MDTAMTQTAFTQRLSEINRRSVRVIRVFRFRFLNADANTRFTSLAYQPRPAQ
jgi:hypothetical protein